MLRKFAVFSFAWIVFAACAMGEPFKVCLVSGSFEYSSDEALAVFKKYLESRFDAKVTLLKASGWDKLPGLEALDTCDAALFYTRRLKLTGEPLERIKKYCRSGKPIVAVRTASHGFQEFLEFDKEILGGNYQNHLREGPTQEIIAKSRAKGHPILDGVGTMRSRYSLYKNKPIANDCTVLLSGKTPDSGGEQPVAWTREVNGGRVFYTSLGGVHDFEGASFQRMIANALYWTAKREPQAKPLPPVPQRSEKSAGNLKFKCRTRTEESPGSGKWNEGTAEREWPAAETAIIVCDMWDKHWCPTASKKVDEIAPRMNGVIAQARAAGVQIVHCPSDTMDYYKDTVARRRMLDAPAAEPPAAKDMKEPALPIDDSDGGCPDKDKMYTAWTREHPAIEVRPDDGVSGNGREVYNLFAQMGIKHVIVMGVHTNMCVLARSFAIRQLTKWGFDCVLVRDLTDAMYNPAMPPKVPHEQGVELVVQHIERYWCPSILSEDLINGLPATP